ncbi:MAG: hypothetical protein EZS28_044200, partial [Streblomastix strix]
DSADGSYGTVDSYARNDHSHPINVETNASNIPIVDGVGNNGTSAYYSRHDHVHPQQLTYDGNVTATKFIKSGGTANEILCANGNIKAISDFNTSVAPRAFQIDPADGSLFTSTAVQNQFINNGGVINGITQINPMTDNFNDGLRISRTVESTGSAAIQLGCSRQSNTGRIAGQWAIYTTKSNYINNPLGLTIGLSSESGSANRGLQISADGNTLSFNGSVIAGTGASNGASNGSVNYSAGNPILWGMNSTDANGGFYSNGTNICWRARPVTLGSVPP